MTKKIIRSLIATTCLITFIGFGTASAETLRVGMECTYAPFNFKNEDGTGGSTGKWYGYCNGDELDGAGNRYSAESCPQSSWTIGDEADNGLLHIPGSLAMAKTSAANTGSSQFYIVPGDSTPSHLDGVHTVFGQVISGLDHVTAISEADTPNSTNNGNGDTPINEVLLIQVTVND